MSITLVVEQHLNMLLRDDVYLLHCILELVVSITLVVEQHLNVFVGTYVPSYDRWSTSSGAVASELLSGTHTVAP